MHTVKISNVNLDPASKGRMRCELELDGKSYRLELWYGQHYATPEWLGQSIFDALDGSEYDDIEALADDVVKRIKTHEDGFMMRDVIVSVGCIYDGSFMSVIELYNV